MRDFMAETKSPPSVVSKKTPSFKLFNLFRADHTMSSHSHTPSEDESPRSSTNSATASSDHSPYVMSPYNASSAAASPFVKSPWTTSHSACAVAPEPPMGLVGSMIREEGHLYSLAAAGDLLYTGSDSKNIRVWKNRAEFSGFKSGSGLVKAIVIAGDRIFTGHQDGKIRVWKVSPNDPSVYKRVGALPKLKDYLKSSINPSNYVEVRRRRSSVWLRHFDAVSCLSLDEEAGLLYSGSWDKTFKVWRVVDSRCLESVVAHDDAINSVAVGFDGLVFTGSADGTVKVWRREVSEKRKKATTRHMLVKVLLQQESAVTALAVAREAGVVYCGTSDGVVNFWEKGTRLVHGGVLRGHKLAVLCLATAPGGLVMSGSADRTIRVWRRDPKNGAHERVAVLAGHAGPIKCLAVGERDGGPGWVLYSGSLDKSVKVWRVAEQGEEERRPPWHVRRTPPHVTGEGWEFDWRTRTGGQPGRRGV